MAMETIRTFRVTYSLILIIAIVCYVEQINAQEIAKSNPNKPDVRIKVNKEFDNKGNITRYDSTYSYSWSGNGQIPMDADSLLKKFNHNFSFGGDIDSMFNHFGFSSPFDDSPFFNQPFAHSNKQFKGNQFPSDSLNNNDQSNFFSRDYREMLKKQHKMMDQFLRQLYQNNEPLIPAPNDSIPLKVQPKGKFKFKNQNYPQGRKSDKTIII